jgi:hypothetical protein
MSTMTATADSRATARPLRCGHGRTPDNDLQRNGTRLTQRGRLVVVLALFAIMVLFVVAGAFRATAAPAGPPLGWTPSVVQPGQTLWELAQSRTAGGDPRELIVQIKAVNGLVDSQLVSGQRLLLPS